MRQALRIVQLTDLHVAGPGERPRDVDVREHFERVIAAVPNAEPDYLVLTGDVSFRDGDTDAYAWVRGHLEATGIPYAVIAGNHDISDRLAHSFGLDDDLHRNPHPELYYRRQIGARDFVFLDTSLATMSDAQFRWFGAQVEEISRHQAEPPVVFMHHPPFAAGCRFMDTHYPFLATDRFLRATGSIEPNEGVRCTVFCGHYHAEAAESRDGVRVFITPSLWFQIDREARDMVMSGDPIGYRIIEFGSRPGAGGSQGENCLSTRVVHVPPATSVAP